MPTKHNTLDHLKTTEDINHYLESWFVCWNTDGDGDLDLLQAMLEDSVKAVIKLRAEKV